MGQKKWLKKDYDTFNLVCPTIKTVHVGDEGDHMNKAEESKKTLKRNDIKETVVGLKKKKETVVLTRFKN